MACLGVSVRASIANYETLIANALRRAIRLRDNTVAPRISDLPFLIPALAGKVEFEVLEDDQEDEILHRLFEEAVKQIFDKRFSLEELEPLVDAFGAETTVDVGEGMHSGFYQDVISQLPGLGEAVSRLTSSSNPALRASAVEFILEGLYVNNRLSKDTMQGQFVYRA